MRLKYKPWADQYIIDNPVIFIQDLNDFNDFIKDKKNIKLEIGCGKGQFIREKAIANPDVTFIAIEKYKTVIVTAAKPLEEQPISNLKFFACDISILSEDIRSNCKIDTIFLNFSDPWPKKRHYKRRLTYKSFLNIYEKLLKSDGHIEFKTDNQGLFEYSLSSFSQEKWYFDNISLDLHNTTRDNIKTEYEEKFSKKGFRINYLEARKNNE